MKQGLLFCFLTLTLPTLAQDALSVTGRASFSNLENIRFVGNQFATLESAYADLPASGGTVIVPSGFAETMSALFTMNKANSGFLFMGSANITMGSNQIIVPAGTHGVFFDGMVANGGAGLTQGAQFTYSGTSNAFQIGGSSATTRALKFNNVSILVTGASGSTGLALNNVVYFEVSGLSIIGQNLPGTKGVVMDGTGNFTGTGRFLNPIIAFVGVGVLGVQGMNAVTISGGTIQTFVTGGIGIDIEAGDANYISTDLESNAIGIKLGPAAVNNSIDCRSEANTTDVQAIAGSFRNTVKMRTQSGSLIVKSDAGTNNHISLAIDGDFDTIFNQSGIQSTATGGATLINTVASTSQKFIELANTGHTGFYFGIESSIGGAFFTSSKAYESVLYSPSNNIFFRTPVGRFFGQVNAATFGTATTCASAASPALCMAAPAGSVTVAPAATTKVVNTTAVTSNSQIILTRDNSLGTQLSVTCNTQSSLALGTPYVSARSAGTSFTITLDAAPTANPMCIGFTIVN